MYQRDSAAPVNVGDELDLTVEAVGAKGDGIAKVSGFVLFVPGGKQGERVKVRITKVLKNVGFTEVLSKTAAPAGEAEASTEPEPEPEKPKNYEDTENFGEDA